MLPGAIPKAALPAALLVAGIVAAGHAAAGDGGSVDARPHAMAADVGRPRITRHPARNSLSRAARFAFEARNAAGFECRLDRGAWVACASPRRWRRLAPGPHSFSVRARDGRGRHGRTSRFAWRILQPEPFSIEQVGRVADLYPGGPPAQVPVAVGNPNPAPILVTALRVAATGSPVGCDAGVNLELMPAGVAPSAPLHVPPGATVRLPSHGVAAPTIALRDLPVNQDACQGVRFDLAFGGSAHG